MTTLLPIDANDNIIPAMRLKNSGAHSIAATTGSSTRNSTELDTGTRVISLYATQDMYINFGGDSVTADPSDHFFPKDIYYDFAVGGDNVAQYTHIAARAVSADGTLYISEKE